MASRKGNVAAWERALDALGSLSGFSTRSRCKLSRLARLQAGPSKPGPLQGSGKPQGEAREPGLAGNWAGRRIETQFPSEARRVAALSGSDPHAGRYQYTLKHGGTLLAHYPARRRRGRFPANSRVMRPIAPKARRS